jgi:hypothetical protein
MGIFGTSRGALRSGLGFVLAGILIAAPARAAQIVNGDVTDKTDPLVGIAATPGSATSILATVGTVANTNNYPSTETPVNSVDNSTATKYLNFAKTNAGLITTINANGPQAIVNGIHFSTANDASERDPLTVVLEGTNDPNATTSLNSAWTQIYSGDTGLATDPGRLTSGPTVTFLNAAPFSSYRLLVTGVRNATSANSFQFSEVELVGTTVPEPTFAALGGIAATGLLARRRKRAVV